MLFHQPEPSALQGRHECSLSDIYGAYRLTAAAKRAEGRTSCVFRNFHENMLAIPDYMKTGQLSAGQVLKSLFKPKASAIWSWSDPETGFAYASMIGGKIIKKLFRR